MSITTMQVRINAQKQLFLRRLKKEGVYLRYCPKRGYVYEIVESFLGQAIRLVVALKNGVLSILEAEKAGAMVA